jgi:hypothetical protein
MLSGKKWLKLGGVLSFAVALLHVIIIIVGPSAYRYFGAGEDMAKGAESGSAFPALLTLTLVGIFTIWGFYGFSGANVVRRLPFLKTVLLLIGAVYTLRGVAVFQELLQIATSSMEVAPRKVVFSLVSLVIGLTYLLGTISNWKSLGTGK